MDEPMCSARHKRQFLRLGLSSLLLLGLPAAAFGQASFVRSAAPLRTARLQDSGTSPSDRAGSPQSDENAASQAGDAPLGLSDLADQNPPSTVPSRPVPQVASLGDNAFSSLTRSNFYASPFASYLGAGRGANNETLNRYFGSSSHRSLLRTPEMFGDFRRPGAAITFDIPAAPSEYARPTDFPSASSFSGLRISENNYALPQDRVWFAYSHMKGAFEQPGGDLTLDRFVLGLEKTFFGGNSSAEVRLPIAAGIEPTDGVLAGNTSYAGGSFGNLALILKRVLYADDSKVLAYGLGIEVPTGSQSHALDTSNGPVAISIDPAAVYLTPYVGALHQIGSDWFANGFIQVDVPTSGDKLVAQIGAGPVQKFAINSPAMLQIDLGTGVWLCKNCRHRPLGLAVVSELHIATALTDPDKFSASTLGSVPNVNVNVDESIRTILNSTHGIQASLRNGWSVRTGIVVPLLNERVFDTEATVQVNRRY